MDHNHNYEVSVVWTGSNGAGTTGYTDYERSHTISSPGKPDIDASSDKPFMGDVSKHNPETLLLSAVATCHMLWYLHLCSDAGIIVTNYTDKATAVMTVPSTGSGHFTEATLHPAVTITDATKIDLANSLHEKANEKCFVANSVKFPIHHEPTCIVH